MPMVDMLSSGKCDFNYSCSWFNLVHTDPLGISSMSYSSVHIDFLPSHNVHPMSLIGPYYGSGLLFQELWLCIRVVDVSSEPRSNVHVLSLYCMVYAVEMQPVDMGRFFLPLYFIRWCCLLNHPVAHTDKLYKNRYMHIMFPHPSIIMI